MEIPHLVISKGRACVRLIEAADVLLATGDLSTKEAATITDARALAVSRLRTLVAELPPEVTAQILAASDKLAGFPVGELGLN